MVVEHWINERAPGGIASLNEGRTERRLALKASAPAIGHNADGQNKTLRDQNKKDGPQMGDGLHSKSKT